MGIRFFIYILYALLITSCTDGTSRPASEAEKEESLAVEELLPQFDAHTADTESNKERFREFLQVEVTPDVKNIFCFDDAIGIDSDFQFAFNCNKETSTKIIEKHHFISDTVTTDYAFGLQNDFAWWDKEKIGALPLYSWNNGDQWFKYFWYDPNEEKAYYFDFDL